MSTKLLVWVVCAVLTALEPKEVPNRHPGHLGLVRLALAQRLGVDMHHTYRKCSRKQQNVEQHFAIRVSRLRIEVRAVNFPRNGQFKRKSADGKIKRENVDQDQNVG